jgi:hypothetical protein
VVPSQEPPYSSPNPQVKNLLFRDAELVPTLIARFGGVFRKRIRVVYRELDPPVRAFLIRLGHGSVAGMLRTGITAPEFSVKQALELNWAEVLDSPIVMHKENV